MADNEPREIKPLDMSWEPGMNARDFRPLVQKVDADEVQEVEEAITPAPKGLPVLESVGSQESIQSIAPSELATNASQTVDTESGKVSESSEDESQTSNPTPPVPENSSPSSSTKANPGKSTPPVVAKPPTSA